MAFAYNDNYRSREAVERHRSRPVTLRYPLTQREAHESEALFRNLAEMTSAAIYIFHGERCVYVNPGAEVLTGYTRSELLATKLRSLLPSTEQRTDSARPEASQRPASVPARYELKALTKTGQERWHEVAVGKMMFRGQASVLITCFDITKRKHVEQELQSLTSRLLHLQDEERRRIARELHDITAQNMFAITINLARLQQSSLPPSEVAELLAECRTLGEQSLQEIRTLSYLLHPPMLDQAGLVSALQWYIEGFIKRSGIYVDLVVRSEVGRLPAQVETALFRVVQESLTNIHRHSGSSVASIRLETKGSQVYLQIKDLGEGLPLAETAAALEDGQHLGVGIAGMRQRLGQLGGSLEIKSSNQGTVVTAVVPFTAGGNNDTHIVGG